MAKDKADSQDQGKISKIQQKLTKISPFSKKGEKKKSDILNSKSDAIAAAEMSESESKPCSSTEITGTAALVTDLDIQGAGVERIGKTKRTILQEEEHVVSIQESYSKKQQKRKPSSTSSTGTTGKNTQAPSKKLKNKTSSGAGAGKSDSEKFVCHYCNKSNVSCMIECEACEQWSCLECHSITTEVYKIFEVEENKMHWFCRNCESTAISAAKQSVTKTAAAMKKDRELEQVHDFNMLANKLETKITEKMNEVLQELRGSAKPAVVNSHVDSGKGYRNYADVAKSSVVGDMQDYADNTGPLQAPSKGKQSMSLNNTNAGIAAVEEMIERERRKNNLVVFNLPESTARSPKGRQDYDKKIVDELILDGMGIEGVEVNKVTRLGGIGQNRFSKPRVTLIELQDSSTKNTLLRSAKNLRNKDMWATTYIAPDLTPNQRKQRKELYTELRLRRANGEENIGIRHGEIVKLRDRAVRRQSVMEISLSDLLKGSKNSRPDEAKTQSEETMASTTTSTSRDDSYRDRSHEQGQSPQLNKTLHVDADSVAAGAVGGSPLDIPDDQQQLHA
ncbi:uncharacterized protein LOC135156153 [Lytechinus pictus]|uniref:uncharacterized protein LOC135156153 n=1 Tax=Lytechinus pictus TaxID=7653 RepID=UPI0030B9C46F